MNTNLKYTVILSAYQADNSALDNMLDTDRLNSYLLERCPDTLRAVGVFDGTPEQSFVIHTNSANIVRRVVTVALHDYGQQCVLVSNNRKLDIALHNQDGTRDTIGTRFASLVGAISGARAYTVLNGQYWAVL